jgi:hypothetical protein
MFNAGVRMKAHNLHAVPADSPIRNFNFEKALQINRAVSLRGMKVKAEKTRYAVVIKKQLFKITYYSRT